jgi:hypothetical protein
MNKRAKKRLKESIKKEIAERNPDRQQKNSSSPGSQVMPESRKFTPRPEKKRG